MCSKKLFVCLVFVVMLHFTAEAGDSSDVVINQGGKIAYSNGVVTIFLDSLHSIRNFSGFLNGAHATVIDPPTSQLPIMKDVFKNRSSELTVQFLRLFAQLGLNALRVYDAYWWNTRGGDVAYDVYRHFGLIKEDRKKFVEKWDYPTAKEIIDFCGENNISLSIVAETIYDDLKRKKVYETRQVAENAEGILNTAAEINAGELARYYDEKGYKNQFIIEIGNETIGFKKDDNPTDQEYARLAIAYCKAIKAICPRVQTAVVARELDYGHEAKQGFVYSYDHVRFRSFLSMLKRYYNLIDFFVIHMYNWNGWKVGLRTVRTAEDHLTNTVRDLNSCGFQNSDIIVTEYNESLWDSTTRTYQAALIQTAKQIVMVSNPRVKGMFVHYIVGGAFLDYSNGKIWTSYPNGSQQSREKNVEHLPDLDPELGPRWRLLPDGFAVSMLSKIIHGNLYSYYDYGEQGQVVAVVTGTVMQPAIMILNNSSDSLQVKIKGMLDSLLVTQLTTRLTLRREKIYDRLLVDSVKTTISGIEKKALPPYSLTDIQTRQ